MLCDGLVTSLSYTSLQRGTSPCNGTSFQLKRWRPPGKTCTSGESDTQEAPGMVPLLRKEQAMYAAIRKYSLIPVSIKEVMRRIEGGFLPLISETPGFFAYYALKVRENELVTISIFDTLAEAQESTPLALDWVQKYIADLVQGDPEVTVGRVFAVGEGLAVRSR
jgi:hypothetical protein